MMKIQIKNLREKLVDYLYQQLSVKIVDETVTDYQTVLTLDSVNKFCIEIDEYGITILYSDEHDQFLLSPYKNEEEFFNDVVKHIKLLLQNDILIEYVHSGKTLLGYKIWIVGKNDEQRKLLKKVTTCFNPILRLIPKSITTKKVCFRNGI